MSILIQSQLISLLNTVLNQSGTLRTNGIQLLYHCPFCKHHKKKLEICVEFDNPHFGKFHCWVCNTKGGSIGKLFRRLKVNRTYYTSLYALIPQQTTTSYIANPSVKNDIELTLPPEFKSLAVPSRNPIYTNALYYIKRRHITRDDILRYNIGYCESGEYSNRIIIPSYDSTGKLNYYVSRSFCNSDGLATYKNCPYSKNIIGFELFINWAEPITLVESVFNAITIRNNSIPLFGKTIPPTLVEALIDNDVIHVNMCLDKDADSESIKLCEALLKLTHIGIKLKFVELPLKDPNEIGFRKMNSLIKNAPVADFTYLYQKKLNILR